MSLQVGTMSTTYLVPPWTPVVRYLSVSQRIFEVLAQKFCPPFSQNPNRVPQHQNSTTPTPTMKLTWKDIQPVPTSAEFLDIGKYLFPSFHRAFRPSKSPISQNPLSTSSSHLNILPYPPSSKGAFYVLSETMRPLADWFSSIWTITTIFTAQIHLDYSNTANFLYLVLSRTQRRLPTQIRAGFQISRIRSTRPCPKKSLPY